MALNPKMKILLNSSNLWNFGDGLFGPLFAVYAQDIGGDILDVSWAWSVYLIASGIFTILMGKISDKYNKEKLMILGYALTAVFAFAYIFVTTPMHLLLIQVGLGFALAVCNPTWYALYSEHSKGEDSGYAWGLSDGQGKVLVGLAVIIGGYLAQNASFTWLFILMGTIQTISTIYLAKILYLENDKNQFTEISNPIETNSLEVHIDR